MKSALIFVAGGLTALICAGVTLWGVHEAHRPDPEAMFTAGALDTGGRYDPPSWFAGDRNCRPRHVVCVG
ncbi:hypothetical protein [Phenylobacterium aquaticum]|nr:hypothetical protein [Phenylobacterium aquaticum]